MSIRNTIQTLSISACLLAAFISASGQATAPKPARKPATAAAPATVPAADPHAVVEKEILNELRQIRALLQQEQQRPQQAAVAAASAPPSERAKVSSVGFEMGSKDAPLTIIEFTDYQCPYCKQFHTTVFNRLKKDYIDTGKVRFISRDLPLDFHSNALGAAQAARCAGEQNQYWQMRDAMIQHSDKLQADSLTSYATQLSLDMPRFQTCMEKQTYAASIHKDLEEANAAGISGTPSFVIGPTTGASLSGELLIGNQTYETFEKALAGSAR